MVVKAYEDDGEDLHGVAIVVSMNDILIDHGSAHRLTATVTAEEY